MYEVKEHSSSGDLLLQCFSERVWRQPELKSAAIDDTGQVTSMLFILLNKRGKKVSFTIFANT